jgi:hypothetical protein
VRVADVAEVLADRPGEAERLGADRVGADDLTVIVDAEESHHGVLAVDSRACHADRAGQQDRDELAGEDIVQVAVRIAFSVDIEADRLAELVDPEQLVDRRVGLVRRREDDLMEIAIAGPKPKLALLAGLALFVWEKKPTVIPMSFSPVTWVWAEFGKLSIR